MKGRLSNLKRSALEIAHLGNDLLLIGVDSAPESSGRTRSALSQLTPAERTAVELVLRGMSNRSIAGVRAASASTVAKQLTAAYRKLGIASRRELMALGERLLR